jgi:hypothetical protein
MIPDVVSASYKGDYKIEVEFENGEKGTVDFSKYLEKGGVFDRFKDIDFFKNFTINREVGVLTWQNDIDVAPETLYAEATGTPIPGWTEKKGPSANKRLQRTSTNRG